MSLAPKLLNQFDKSIVQAGYSDRIKAIQLHYMHLWMKMSGKGLKTKQEQEQFCMLYDNHTYNQDRESIHAQHEYADISASTHVHLNPHNCLETIMEGSGHEN